MFVSKNQILLANFKHLSFFIFYAFTSMQQGLKDWYWFSGIFKWNMNYESSEKLLTISTAKNVRCEQEHFMVLLLISVSQPNVAQLSSPSKKREQRMKLIIKKTLNELGLLIEISTVINVFTFAIPRNAGHISVLKEHVYFHFAFTLSGDYNKINSATKPSLPYCYV